MLLIKAISQQRLTIASSKAIMYFLGHGRKHTRVQCLRLHGHNDIITRNDGKIRTSEKLAKLYSIRKVFTQAVQKCNFDQILGILSKVKGI